MRQQMKRPSPPTMRLLALTAAISVFYLSRFSAGAEPIPDFPFLYVVGSASEDWPTKKAVLSFSIMSVVVFSS